MKGHIHMQTIDRTPDATPDITTGRRLVVTYNWLTVVIALAVLLQAVLAGQGMFNGKPGLIDGHATVGDILVIVTIVTAGITFYARNLGLLSTGTVIRNLVTVVLMVVQLMIGYATRDSSNAIAWHIPNGVLLMGLTTANAVLAWFTPPRR
jgi:hypothetical protein